MRLKEKAHPLKADWGKSIRTPGTDRMGIMVFGKMLPGCRATAIEVWLMTIGQKVTNATSSSSP